MVQESTLVLINKAI